MKKINGIILALLEEMHAGAGFALSHENTMQMMVSVMLSAQCTDERVNRVTEKLYRKYKTPADFAQAERKAFEKEIFSTGYYRQKTKNILAAAKKIESEYGGRVPGTMEGLLSLPGIGRKSANVVLQHAFGKTEGVVVDTHVKRVARRLGLTQHTEPEKVEKDLMEGFPREKWGRISDLLIFHGRKYCMARKPNCAGCLLNKICPSSTA